MSHLENHAAILGVPVIGVNLVVWITEALATWKSWVVAGFVLVTAFGIVHAAPRMGRVCFERAEDGGLMNVHLVRLVASRDGRAREVARLRGGEKSCVDLEGGAWSIEARSTRPYDPSPSDPDACRSRPLRIRVEQKDIRVTVSPQSKGSAYICGWDLR